MNPRNLPEEIRKELLKTVPGRPSTLEECLKRLGDNPTAEEMVIAERFWKGTPRCYVAVDLGKASVEIDIVRRKIGWTTAWRIASQKIDSSIRQPNQTVDAAKYCGPRQMTALTAKHLYEEFGFTLQDLADTAGVTRERIRQFLLVETGMRLRKSPTAAARKQATVLLRAKELADWETVKKVEQQTADAEFNARWHPARQLYASGFPIREIAKRCGRPLSSLQAKISHLRKAYGWFLPLRYHCRTEHKTQQPAA